MGSGQGALNYPGLDQAPKVMVLDRLDRLDRLDGASGLPPIPMHETGFSKRP